MAEWEYSTVVTVWISVSFTGLVLIFIIASGMSERSFCIFRRIHLRLPLASQVAYESLLCLRLI